jgi:FtsP/CotA-like multicopper oxidase with cupredoxin domain
MRRINLAVFMTLLLATFLLVGGTGVVYAQTSPSAADNDYSFAKKSHLERSRIQQQRLRELTEAEVVESVPGVLPAYGFNPLVDYAAPNFAQSPNLRKFVDSLPGLGMPGCTPGTGVSPNVTGGTCQQNNLGQYIQVANPDQTMYPGSDYYEIGLRTYQKQMHSDLPAAGTKLRGYYQINNGTKFGTTADHSSQYLGGVIVANKNVPVRIKFINELGVGALGDLPLPVDTTVMGAGMGPTPGFSYTQNRADLHLHGGLTPWISDGTPHQWITPAGEALTTNPYLKGVSFQNVPDMVGAGAGKVPGTAGDGMATYYYPNQQSARLMFYHDHAYGITRLNVYAGEASGYLLTDQVEEDLLTGTNVSTVFTAAGIAPTQILPNLAGLGLGPAYNAYKWGIPLIIQDRTFVNDATTPPHASFAATGATATSPTLTTDPRWNAVMPTVATTGGDFWFPHEYMPNENIFDPTGFNPMGRWDYGPFMIPPMMALNPYPPSPTIIPEAYGDTMIVNGTAFPYVALPPTAIRFRILNACNDRFLNLQLYYAKDKVTGNVCKASLGLPFTPADCTEVSMVPAAPGLGHPATWPVDGRPGGVPDPATVGPNIIQIGNEGGFLAAPAVTPPQPVDFDYSRRSVTFGGVTSKSLLITTAVRADVIVDFSSVAAGDVLMLYNDGPAPMPLYDSRYDYFTDDPDQTAGGGAPSTPGGFGPNTRTIMQVRIAGAAPAFNLTPLLTTNILAKAFATAQDAPLVPQAAYNAAYGTAYPDVNGGLTVFANSVAETLNVSSVPVNVAKVVTILPGLGYATPPAVNFYGGNCATPPSATATLNGVTGITLITAGAGYTVAPAVTVAAPNTPGSTATAVATISGGVVTVITVTDPGSGYTVAPAVTIAAPAGGTAATAQATITLGSVGTITLTPGTGLGCTTTPLVVVAGGGGMGATAEAWLQGALVLTGKNLVEGFDIEYGRMNAVLGSTPNPLAPTVGAGPVIGMARYIDPPTEIMNDGELVLWRLTHLGVDSHSLHFHLFNVQVINRVDWTNTIKPPYPDELGWKETIRTNPFEDIIVAIKPIAPTLPWRIPDSIRLLDPTTPLGSTTNFAAVAPPPGLPAVAQTTNTMTNFNWEYVWHCHLLGHEENDMMRPIAFVIPPPLPPTLLPVTVWSIGPPLSITLSWTIVPSATSYTIQRATNTGFTAGLKTYSPAGVGTTFVDNTGLVGNTRYYYRVRTLNPVGTSAWSNVVNFQFPAPLAPTGLAVTGSSAVAPLSITLSWTNNALDAIGFTIQRATNTNFTQGLATFSPAGLGTTFINNTGLVANTRYYYRVRALNSYAFSAWSNVVNYTITTPAPAAPPTGLATGAISRTSVVLNWTLPVGGTQTGFTIQRATNAGFTTGVRTTNVNSATAVTTTITGLTPNTLYYFRIAARNAGGISPYSAAVSATTLP